MIGETLGSYKIVGKLGEGGMGVVYVAEHPLIGRRAAIKLLHPDLSKNEEIVARFFNEARASTLIKHPGIVDIFDFGYHPTNGSAYIAMEYLEGESLAARMRRQRKLPLAMGAGIGRQIAGVLGAAHAKGIVHRDLKPDNVYLCPDADMPGGERVKLLDFGIAKLAQAGEATKTRTGSVLGTPAYMSPEQCRGAGEVDHRADVYALGCMLYEMAVGRPPFVAEGVGELIGAHLHMQPDPLRAIDPAVPPAFEALVMKCMMKQPAQRYQKMADLARDLERFTAGGYQTPIPNMTPPGFDVNASTLPGNTPVPGVLPGTRVDPTTLAGAAGQTAAGTGARRSGKGWIAAGATVALVAGATAVVLIMRTKGSPGTGVDAGLKKGGVLGHELLDPRGRDGKPIDAGVATTPPPSDPNPWVRIDPPGADVGTVLLGVSYDDVPVDVAGFRPGRKIAAPSNAYEIQEHEVTWGELEPWLDKNADHRFDTTSIERAPELPATGVPWTAAGAYCASLGGALPTEEQWEFAARGAERRPYPWGGARIDPARTHVYAGAGAKPKPVKQSAQDKTPNGIYDLLGNAQEWTVDLWREDQPGQDESWVSEGGLTYRAIRGLPFAGATPKKLPQEGAAHRMPLCATGECHKDTAIVRRTVGFRCARDAR